MSEKSVIFVQNSIIKCFYHKRQKNKMSTSLHPIFNVISSNVYFVIVSSNICGRKTRFSESSQNSVSEKSIFGQFEVIFLNVYTWGGGGRARGQKALQKHFYCIPFVFITIYFHSAFTFMRFKSSNRTVISQFYQFPDRNNFGF